MKLHPLTLKFDGDSSHLETLFQKDHFRASLPRNRAAMIVEALFYSGFGLLDYLLMPENKGMTWLIRRLKQAGLQLSPALMQDNNPYPDG